jgi:ammonium transporter, Amt family
MIILYLVYLSYGFNKLNSNFSLCASICCRFGCYGFNAGSAVLTDSPMFHQILALCATNTSLAGGAGGISAVMVNLWYLERYTGEPCFDLKKAMNGSLTGLIAIAGSCGVIEPWSAVIIGAVAGVIYLMGSNMLIRLRIDDACDAIPVHGSGGLWGVIAVGLFASPNRLLEYYGKADHPGLFFSWHMGNSDFRLLGAQVVGALFIMGWVLAFMLPFFVWLDWRGWLRSDPLEELVGLDTSYHGGLALLTNDSDVKEEHITAYKNRQTELSNLRRRSSANKRSSVELPKTNYKSEEDDEEEVEVEDGFDPKISM